MPQATWRSDSRSSDSVAAGPAPRCQVRRFHALVQHDLRDDQDRNNPVQRNLRCGVTRSGRRHGASSRQGYWPRRSGKGSVYRDKRRTAGLPAITANRVPVSPPRRAVWEGSNARAARNAFAQFIDGRARYDLVNPRRAGSQKATCRPARRAP